MSRPEPALTRSRSASPASPASGGRGDATEPTVKGDLIHPANFGRLCSKGGALGETLGLDGRLLDPMIGGRTASWDEALDHVARGFADTVERHGPDAVAFYVSGQLLTEDYYVANKLMKGFIGSGNIDTNSRLCMASSVAGHRRAFGEDVVPGCYEDWEQADLAVYVGSNAAWCHPILHRRLLAARETRGTRIVVIDPRRTATCDEADLHLPIAPGTDVLLFNGLLAHLVRTGALDRGWIAAHAADFEQAAMAAADDAPDITAVAAGCHLPEEAVRRFYGWFAETPATLTIYSQGVNQSTQGTDKVNAIVNCHLATGRIGRPGAGPFSVTGQPNAMGGREVGGLANQLAAHMAIEDPAARDRVRRFWQAPRLTETPGLKAVDLFEAVAQGRIKALWIMATNPAVSAPDAERLRRGLRGCDLVVVSDVTAETDTARLADVLLPAAGWGEKDGTVTNSERRISRQRAFRPPPGQVRPDWWIVTQVARRMGFAAAFPYEDPAAIFREHAALSVFENDGDRVFDLGGLAALDQARYDALEPVQWPVPASRPLGTARLFADGRFPTPDGRARFIAVRHRAPAHRTDRDRPMLLNTGRLRDQWHTMTRTGAVPRLAANSPEPAVELHPDDAGRHGLAEGDLARLDSAWGRAVARVRLTPDQAPGQAFLAMHWNDRFTADCVAGKLASPAVDPISGQPELKHIPIALRRIALGWEGFLISRRRQRPTGLVYWTRRAAAGCQIYTLGGPEPPADGIILGRSLLAPAGGREVIEFADARRGLFRLATLDADGLAECLYVAPPGHLPDPEWLLARFAAEAPEIDETDRRALLSGRAPAGAATEGRIVCACLGVGLDRILRALRDGQAIGVKDLGALLGAGTNCGSCVPELKEIVAHADLAAAG
ncbi:assimilatory nitrate reductase catalytic subunit [Inquilinus ginsengisoli]|uniref:Assimilatory nitrate reductase catalytic subunit n=1 Tax=Inquilinus ginsengisoli TaxID=363840 RepID=A0ABU1JGU1_9PROT|nr:assimilatory nitrate reductase catalytic subunit [Inquilinus ginsengisoli]